MIHDLQEQRAFLASGAGQCPYDHIVDEPCQVRDRRLRRIGIKNLKEVSESLGCGFLTKYSILLQRTMIRRQVIVESYGVQA